MTLDPRRRLRRRHRRRVRATTARSSPARWGCSRCSAPGWPSSPRNPDLVITDGEALFLAGAPPLGREGRRGRGLDPVPPGLRRGRLRQAARDDGRHPDRPLRQPEHLRDRRLRPAEAAAARRRAAPRATPSTTDVATGCPSTPPASSSSRSTSSPASGPTRAKAAGPAAARFNDIHRVVTNLGGLRLRAARTTRCGCVSRAPGRHRRRGARGHRLRARTSPTATCPTTREPTDEELIADPRGARPEGRCAIARSRQRP